MWISEHDASPSIVPGDTGTLFKIWRPGQPDRFELRADPSIAVALPVPGSGSGATCLGKARVTRRSANGRYCLRRIG